MLTDVEDDGDDVISFRGLSYSVPDHEAKGRRLCSCFPLSSKSLPLKPIFKNLNGNVKQGEVLAIMGGSGAGKTTLLDVLAGRSNKGTIEGKMEFYGRPRSKFFSRTSKYVMQSDVHLPGFTVRETLRFGADLRLADSVSESEKEARIEELLDILGLRGCAETEVGSELQKGISGGEARRLTIGLEIIDDPDILFLDEPTTGLDSNGSFYVFQLLRELADRLQRTIVCAIHQPSVDVFKMFDKLLLMGKTSEGFGQLVYFGSSADAVEVFRGFGFSCPSDTNPADFLLAMAGGSIEKAYHEDDEEALELVKRNIRIPPVVDVDEMVEAFKNYSIQEEAQADLARGDSHDYDMTKGLLHGDNEDDEGSDDAFYKSRYPTSRTSQIKTLTKRTMLTYIRSPNYLKVRIGRVLIIALLLASVYYDIDDSQGGVQDRISLLFFCIVTTFLSAMGLLPTFIDNRALVVRERSAKLYGALSYFVANMLCVVPFDLLNSALYSVIVYWSVGLNSGADHFFLFFLIYLSLTVINGGYVLCISAVSDNVTTASSYAPVLFSTFLMFCGFMVLPSNIPDWWYWMYRVSPFSYAFQVLLYNEFSGQTFECDSVSSSIPASPPPPPPGPMRHLLNVEQRDCAFPTGEAVLEFYDAEDDNTGRNIAIVLSFVVFFRLLNLIILKYMKHGTR